ncbi:unnamed protein product, partial [Rotaria sp. Silwood2]
NVAPKTNPIRALQENIQDLQAIINNLQDEQASLLMVLHRKNVKIDSLKTEIEELKYQMNLMKKTCALGFVLFGAYLIYSKIK